MVALQASIKTNCRLGTDLRQAAEEFHIGLAPVAIPGPPRRRPALFVFHV
jgi:hypothetical protein